MHIDITDTYSEQDDQQYLGLYLAEEIKDGYFFIEQHSFFCIANITKSLGLMSN